MIKRERTHIKAIKKGGNNELEEDYYLLLDFAKSKNSNFKKLLALCWNHYHSLLKQVVNIIFSLSKLIFLDKILHFA